MFRIIVFTGHCPGAAICGNIRDSLVDFLRKWKTVLLKIDPQNVGESEGGRKISKYKPHLYHGSGRTTLILLAFSRYGLYSYRILYFPNFDKLAIFSKSAIMEVRRPSWIEVILF